MNMFVAVKVVERALKRGIHEEEEKHVLFKKNRARARSVGCCSATLISIRMY